MLDNEFLEFLEYKICKTYEKTIPKATKLWCKSVTFYDPNQNVSYDFISEEKQLQLIANVGKFGKEQFHVLLNFGALSLVRLEKEMEIRRCLISRKNPELIIIDFDAKTINIQLE